MILDSILIVYRWCHTWKWTSDSHFS